MVKKILFLNSLLFLGLLCSITSTYSIPVEVIPSSGIVYPIHVACECDYNLYVDGKKINPSGIVTSWDGTEDGVNVTNIFNPVLFEPSPKIIAFNNIDNEYPVFMNGFVMDMNNGKDYTKHRDWKCKYFDPKVSSIVPSNWMDYDYDDSEWEMAVSYGMNYQNNSYQIFEHERDGIHLHAEWLWTSVNSNPNIYCRKKRVDIEPYYVETKPVTTSAPSQTIHVGFDKTTLSSIHTIPPHTQEVLYVSHTSSTPTPAAEYKPVVTPMPTSVAEHKPVVSLTSTPVAEHKPVVSLTSTPVAEHNPAVTPTSTPLAEHKPAVTPTSTTVAEHKPVVTSTATPVAEHKPVVTSTATPVAEHQPVITPTATSVAEHQPVITPTATTVVEHKPAVKPTPSHVVEHKQVVTPTPTNSKNNIIIYQRINYVIQNFKYNQKHSYSHMENLIRNLKSINQNHNLYDNLMNTRNHLHRHYNTMFKELYRLRKKYDDNDPYDNDDDDEEYRILPFIHSMKILDKYIQEIEKYIQFIRGKYKYILMNTLLKLKLQYREDTIKLLQYYDNGFNI